MWPAGEESVRKLARRASNRSSPTDKFGKMLKRTWCVDPSLSFYASWNLLLNAACEVEKNVLCHKDDYTTAFQGNIVINVRCKLLTAS